MGLRTGSGSGSESEAGAGSDSPDDVGGRADPGADPGRDDWYRWGRRVLYAEMLLAVAVTVFSLYTAMTGSAGVLA
jgi:hypothetical protein